MRTWYEVLGVPPTAGTEEVRAAFRANVRALHPDSRDPSLPPADADAALRLVNAAWAVLGDRRRRAAYDAELARSAGVDALDGDGQGDGDGLDPALWAHAGPRFPWWLVILAVLLVIFVFTAYAGTPVPAPGR
ncbi:MAG TPA: J domain-containing protein [Acidimicrobiales bacterium]|nr:J domain-containing protein [Acidimicrobiales bacterium]